MFKLLSLNTYRIILTSLMIIIIGLTTFSCSTNKSTDWRKMECGLYMSPKGDIGYASIPERANIDQSELTGEECPNSFLTTFGYNDTTQLKYVIDTLTFEHIESSFSFYKDTNYIYNHYDMCDGGYFDFYTSDISKFELLNNNYIKLDTAILHHRRGPIYADLNTFAVSSKYNHLACDKNFFYSFGEKMTLEEFEESESEEIVENLKNLQSFWDFRYLDIDTNFFSTGSMLYWQWDRDSSWMTFESEEHEKIILMTLESGLMDYTHRLGLCFIKEYDDFLLFKYRWISGCCTPPDMVFLDKKTGKEIERISNLEFIWYEWEDDYIIYFSDSLYTSITYFNLENNTIRETNLSFERGASKLSHSLANEYYPSDIFYTPKVKKNHIVLEYIYQHPDFKDSLMTDVIRINK